MTSRNLKHFAAFGATAALVLAGMLVLGSGLTARARAQASAMLASHCPDLGFLVPTIAGRRLRML